jgi:CheY-like chemotaxis protein
MKNFKVLVLGNKKVTRKIENALGHSEGISLICENDIVEAITRLRQQKFELAVIDSRFEDLAVACYRINHMWNVPLGLLTGKEESGWDNLRFLDIDGYVPADSSRTDLYAHFEEITTQGRTATPEIKRDLNVLVVEDDTNARRAIEQAFKFYWPEAALNFTSYGDEAVKIAQTEPVDMILMNIGLHDKMALDALEKIRTFSQVPVIVLTENKDEDKVIDAMKAGASDYLEKTYRPIELITRVRQNIRQATGLGKSSSYVKKIGAA